MIAVHMVSDICRQLCILYLFKFDQAKSFLNSQYPILIEISKSTLESVCFTKKKPILNTVDTFQNNIYGWNLQLSLDTYPN